MKKFYSVIAAGFVGSLMGASAFNAQPWNASANSLESRSLFAAPTVKVENSGRDVIKGVKGDASRDDEGIDITQFTQMLGYDYFGNWTDENGNEVNQFRYILTGCHSDIVYNEPTDDAPYGSFTVMNYSGLDDVNVQMNITEEGGLEIPLGQLAGSTSSYNLYFVAMLPSYDENGDPICNDQGQVIIDLVDEGALPMDIYTNAFCTNEYVGIYAREKFTQKGAGFYVLYTFNNFMMPNATLSFDYYTEYSDGTVDSGHADNRVYTEFAMVENNPDVMAEFMISNVTKFNSGTSVNFEYWDLGDGEYLIIAPMAVAYLSENMGGGQYTGDFILAYLTADSLGGDVLASELEGQAGEPGYSFTFPTEDPELGITGIEGWCVVAPNTGYWFGQCSTAVLTVDGEPGDNGISGIISDDNAPATFYNLQGMQIQNPTPGQVYIVKQGNKASKHIIK